MALELYRKDKVSLGPVAELRQTPVAAFMDFSAKHGVRLALFFHNSFEPSIWLTLQGLCNATLLPPA
jgi:hypothetical protein